MAIGDGMYIFEIFEVLLIGAGIASVMVAVMCMIFYFAVAFMPYVCSLCAIVIAYTAFPVLKTWIPGHPYVCLLVEVALVEFLTYKLISCEATSRPLIAFSCVFFVGIASGLILEGLKPSTIWYCIFLNVLYVMATIFCVRFNLSHYGVTEKKTRNWILRIIAAVIYAAGMDTMIVVSAEYIWLRYYETIGTKAPQIFYTVYHGSEIVFCALTGIISIYFDRMRQWDDKYKPFKYT